LSKGKRIALCRFEARHSDHRHRETGRQGAKALAQHEAEALAVREKTIRLRTAHLAKEAAEVETEVKPVLCGPEFPSDFNH
jgi:hypothetical protein